MSNFTPTHGSSGMSLTDLQATIDAPAANEAVRTAAERVGQLEARLDRLLLVIQAMWNLLRQKNGSLDEQLLLDQVNLRVQRKTEQLQSPPKCPQCGRPMSPRLSKCMYCGANRPIDTVFDAV